MLQAQIEAPKAPAGKGNGEVCPFVRSPSGGRSKETSDHVLAHSELERVQLVTELWYF